MSTTPRTDEAQFGTGRVSVDFARHLETELAAMTARAEKAEAELAPYKDTTKGIGYYIDSLVLGELDAQSSLAAEREKVRVLREALQNGVAFPITGNWYEQAAAALTATEETSK